MTQTLSLIFEDGTVSQPLTSEVSALLSEVRTIPSTGIHWTSVALDYTAYLEVSSEGTITVTNLNAENNDVVFKRSLSQSELRYLQLMRSSGISSDGVNPQSSPLQFRSADNIPDTDSVIEIGLATHELQDETTKDVARVMMVTISFVSGGDDPLEWCFPTLVSPGMTQHVSDWDDESGLPMLFQPF